MADTDPTLPEKLLPDATRRLIRTADALDDAAYGEPSGLPDWTRAHVLAHLALNAEGLAAVLTGIVEDEQVPMYASQEARDGDIHELAARDAATVRARLLAGCTDLSDAIAAVPDDRWGTVVERTPGGRTFPAAAVAGMRLTEVEIHHADLAAGYGWRDWPPEFCAHLLDTLVARGGEPVRAEPTDLEGTWTIGSDGPTVSGPAGALGWWLTGRGGGEDLTSDRGALPQIGRW